MDFVPYGKTKHSNDQGFINRVLQDYPELSEEDYVATEKLDGTNFTILIDENGTMRQGSRNQELTVDMCHFDWHNAVQKQYAEELCALMDWCRTYKTSIRLYGELFGQGVLKRIDYGPNKFLPFQMDMDDVMLSPSQAMDFMDTTIGYVWWVPIIAKFNSLKEAIAWDVDGFTDRKIEGVVIELWNKSFIHPHRGKFKFKAKTKKFADSMGVKQKTPKDALVLSESAQYLFDNHQRRFTLNRIYDMISKEGPLTEMSQMGKYIKLVCQDVKEDFLLEFKDAFSELTDAERKAILGSGGRIVSPMVKDVILRGYSKE